jgi:acyl-CoA hydrolase
MPFAKHQLSMTVLMTPDMANFSGKVHGGHILKLLDQVAYACASRYAGMYVVTLSVDRVQFRQPVRVGELVTFFASVNYTGRTSMEVGIKVVSEDIHLGIATHTNSCFFTMVAMDTTIGTSNRRRKATLEICRTSQTATCGSRTTLPRSQVQYVINPLRSR